MLSIKEVVKNTGAANGAVYNKIVVEKTARPAVAGEVIDTIINGEVETSNTANEGDMIITGLAGEEYIISGNKFHKLYVLVSGNTYQTKPDSVQAVEVSDSFSFLAPWGSEMICNVGDYIVYRSQEDVYRIERTEFLKTYTLA